MPPSVIRLFCSMALLLCLSPAHTADQNQVRQAAQWLEQDLKTVIADCSKRMGLEVQWSEQAMKKQDLLITLYDKQQQPASYWLTEIAMLGGLHITSGDKHVQVTDIAEHSKAIRRIYSAERFGLLNMHPDFYAPSLGYHAQPSGAGGMNLFGHAGDTESAPEFSADVMLNLLRVALQASDPDLLNQQGINLAYNDTLKSFILDLPRKAHRQAQRSLQHMGNERNKTYSSHVYASSLEHAPASTGIVSAATLDQIIATLPPAKTRRLTLSGVHGRRCSTAALRQQAIVSGLNVTEDGDFDPVIDTVNSGVTASIRMIMGHRLHVSYDLAWTELERLGHANISAPPSGSPAKIHIQGKLASPKAQQTAGKSATQSGDAVSLSGELSDHQDKAAESHQLDLPELWSWKPRGEIILQHGHGLVLACKRDDGRYAVWVVKIDTGEPHIPDVDDAHTPAQHLQKLAKHNNIGLRIAAHNAKQQAPSLQEQSWHDYRQLAAGHGWNMYTNQSNTGGQVLYCYPPHPQTQLHQVTYAVASLSQNMTDYPAPRLHLPEPGIGSGQLFPAIQDDKFLECSDLMDLIEGSIEEDAWVTDGAGIDEYNGQLIIALDSNNHDRVRMLLHTIEQQRSKQLQGLVYEVPATTALGLQQPGQWQQTKSTASLLCQVLLRDGQRNHHFNGRQVTYLADGDRKHGKLTPVPASMNLGLAVDLDLNAQARQCLVTVRLQDASKAHMTTSSIAQRGQRSMQLEKPNLPLNQIQGQYAIAIGGAQVVQLGTRRIAIAITE